jgi:hypothetical protein
VLPYLPGGKIDRRTARTLLSPDTISIDDQTEQKGT